MESTTIIAFDQHAATTVAEVLPPGHRTPALHSLTSDSATILRFVARLRRQGVVACCYEAGPCGFELQRALATQAVPCDVIAPAPIPRRAGDRIKTDRRDAGQLAVLYRAGSTLLSGESAKSASYREADMVKQLRPGITYSCIVLATLGFHRSQTVGASATTASAQAGSPTIPITVVSSQVDPTRRKVTFTVQNTGTKVITAWDVTIVAGMEPDAKYGGHGVDAFREFEGLVEGRSYIVPGGTATATATLPWESDNLAPVVVTPSAAIFADTSFAGDAKFAQLVFERRSVQRAAWQEILSQLEQTRRIGSVDAGKLDMVLSDLNSALARNGGDIVRTTFRANLSLAIASVRAGRVQAVSELARLLTEAHRNVAVATAHTKR